MLVVDAHRGFLLPVPPRQLFPSGGSDLHTSWATVSDGPFFLPARGAMPSSGGMPASASPQQRAPQGHP